MAALQAAIVHGRKLSNPLKYFDSLALESQYAMALY